jgi:hypothetical protein
MRPVLYFLLRCIDLRRDYCSWQLTCDAGVWRVGIICLSPGALRCLVASSEKDLDEVLQSETIFANVSKGMVASQADLMAAFGTDDVSAIAPMVRQHVGVRRAGRCGLPFVFTLRAACDAYMQRHRCWRRANCKYRTRSAKTKLT